MTEKQEKEKDPQLQSSADKVKEKIKRSYLPCISCKKDIPADSVWCPYCKIQQGR